MKVLVFIALLPVLFLSGCGRSESTVELKPVFNIPPLIGKRISEVEAVLGPATSSSGQDEMAKSQGLNDGFKSWSRDAASLIIQHDLGTGQIRYFYICSGSKAKEPTFAREDDLLILGNLRRDDPAYRLKFVPDRNSPGRFWALKAIPNG